MSSTVQDGTAPQVVVTGLGVTSAFGRGAAPLLDGVMAGKPAFGPVTRFDTGRCRASDAACLPGQPDLAGELGSVITDACAEAGFAADARAGIPLLVALHADAGAARDPAAPTVLGDTAARSAAATGFGPPPRIYTAACVAASSALADAAAMICSGRAPAVVVAAGYLVDADGFWLFDAGRTLAKDGQVRPFSVGRKGMLLGDAAAAVVLEAGDAAERRGAPLLGRMAGWGRAGDAYHVCQPRPDGTGLARAIESALRRGRIGPGDVGYVNANGSGTSFADASEAAALHRAFGASALTVPVSSTKSVHGHALEASALLEFAVTVLALRDGALPVNAGYLGPDPDCELDLVLAAGREARTRYALTLNAAFGGANTALLLATA